MVELLPFFIALGAAMGSFLTVVAERIDALGSVWTGRSQCNACQSQLRWYELVPVLSYVWLRGQCRRCRAVIPRAYVWFEFIAAISFGLIWWRLGGNNPWWLVGMHLGMVCWLLVLLYSDWLHQTFPSVVLYGALIWATVTSAVMALTGQSQSQFIVSDPFFSWIASPAALPYVFLVGGIVGTLALGALAIPSRERWMGYGDVWLAAILGLWNGYPLIVFTLMLAFYLGAIVGGGMLLFGRAPSDHRIAFGPFLIIAAVIIQVWGESIFYAIMKWWGAL